MKNLIGAALVIGVLFAGAPTNPDEIKGTGGFLTAYSVETPAPAPAPAPTPSPAGRKPLGASPAVSASQYVQSVAKSLGPYLDHISRDLAAHERELERTNMDPWVLRRMVEILDKTPGSMTAEKLNYLERCVTPVRQVPQGACQGCGS
jgi:hypothetical protein